MRKAKRIIATVLALTCGGTGSAQEQRAGSFKAEIKVQVETGYLLFVPTIPAEKPADTKLPMIVFLHGAGERGDDLDLVKVHGPPKIVEKKKKKKKKKDFGFIVLSPQCARRDWWKPEPLMALIDDVAAKYPVDKDRIYLTGLSMGGFGSWSLAARYPDRFAAVAPICGGGNPRAAEKIKHLPIWVFHGAKDDVVPLARSQEMVNTLKAAGSQVKFTVYPEANHDSWTKTYENEELYAWFLEHRRGMKTKSRE